MPIGKICDQRSGRQLKSNVHVSLKRLEPLFPPKRNITLLITTHECAARGKGASEDKIGGRYQVSGSGSSTPAVTPKLFFDKKVALRSLAFVGINPGGKEGTGATGTCEKVEEDVHELPLARVEFPLPPPPPLLFLPPIVSSIQTSFRHIPPPYPPNTGGGRPADGDEGFRVYPPARAHPAHELRSCKNEGEEGRERGEEGREREHGGGDEMEGRKGEGAKRGSYYREKGAMVLRDIHKDKEKIKMREK